MVCQIDIFWKRQGNKNVPFEASCKCSGQAVRGKAEGTRQQSSKAAPWSHWTWSAWGLEYTCQSEPERLGLACKRMGMSLPIYPAHGEEELTAFVVETHRVYNRASNLFRDDLNWQPLGVSTAPWSCRCEGCFCTSLQHKWCGQTVTPSGAADLSHGRNMSGVKAQTPSDFRGNSSECRKNMYIPQTEVLPITESLWSALVGLLPSLHHWCEGMKPARSLGFPTVIGSWGFRLPWVLLAATTLFYSCPFGLPAPRSLFNREWPFYQLWATAEGRGESSVLR